MTTHTASLLGLTKVAEVYWAQYIVISGPAETSS